MDNTMIPNRGTSSARRVTSPKAGPKSAPKPLLLAWPRPIKGVGVQPDVVEICKTLLHGAENGEIVGLVFGAVLQRQRFVTDIAGTCARHLTHARGIVRALDDRLRLDFNERYPDEDR